ncbi:hypothetical protein C8J27_109106 [Rhodobacter aestuarii]|uniref:Helicase/UvrB N-terminal domain-containing protein n=1 Tax=Rhodobacter aestuarii TaxID=453582 RepID=A0A1N7PS29_9RHOB|nr:hypothetical protein C8J27_109106 [Rhodobacter aestuarii]SIT13376.1 hypothetical protein SAMN05421580_11129 [Rhodobacter aestuarii]
MGRYIGDDREPEAEILFASVQTLARSAHLSRFDPQAFDDIVIDEFHHAAATAAISWGCARKTSFMNAISGPGSTANFWRRFTISGCQIQSNMRKSPGAAAASTIRRSPPAPGRKTHSTNWLDAATARRSAFASRGGTLISWRASPPSGGYAP